MSYQSSFDDIAIGAELLSEMDRHVNKMINEPGNIIFDEKERKKNLRLKWIRKRIHQYKSAMKNHRKESGRMYYEKRIIVLNKMKDII